MEREIIDLKITNQVKDIFIKQLIGERSDFVEKLLTTGPTTEQLEAQLTPLVGPKLQPGFESVFKNGRLCLYMDFSPLYLLRGRSVLCKCRVKTLLSRLCIHHHMRSDYIWLDEAKLAVRLSRWRLGLARFPRPVAGWLGKMRRSAPTAFAL